MDCGSWPAMTISVCHPGFGFVIPALERARNDKFELLALALAQHGTSNQPQPIIAKVHVIADENGG